MAAQTRIVLLNQAKKETTPGGWHLCFQYCRYEYANGSEANGYRFIWERPNGSLQAVLGQARIPSIPDILFLVSEAIKGGWGEYLCEPDNADYYLDDIVRI